MRGKRPYMLNRRPYADHLVLAAKNRLVPVFQTRSKRFDGLIPAEFAPQFRNISDEDARTAMALVILRNANA